ncbi:3117_t:CDS:2 [Entrophospora sp. SA101]|nr:3117_t:CDS:2 [Entrophospora sp. SA101]
MACAFSTLPGWRNGTFRIKNITSIAGCQTLTVLVAYTLNNPNSFINYFNSRARIDCKFIYKTESNEKLFQMEKVLVIQQINNKYTLISSNDST